MKTTLLLFFFFASVSGHAQFERFKTNKAAPKDDQKNNTGAQTDTFGRGSGIHGVTKLKKGKQFVNLNPETAFGPEVVTDFNHPNTSLMDLTKFMQKLVGLNLIIDKEGDLKGKVSITTSGPITVGDAWKAYLTALNANGYTLIKSGAFYRIISVRNARKATGTIYTGNYTPDTANYVMRVIPLKHIDLANSRSLLRNMTTRSGKITQIPQTNTLIIQDTGESINRLVRLIKFIDVPGHHETLQIFKVRHSSAQEIAGLLDQILQGGSKGRFRSRRKGRRKSSNISRIIAEPRTNTIIAMANADGAKHLRSLIKKLDTKTVASSSGQIHVYYLNHGDAEKMATTLDTLVNSSGSRKRRSGSRRRGRSKSNLDNNLTLFNNVVKITADVSNNALVVTASPTDYLTIKAVIKKLDIPKDQVYVEGLIMETNVSRGNNYGMSLAGAYGAGQVRRFGFEAPALASLLTNQITQLGGFFYGLGAGKKIPIDIGGGKEVEVNSVNGLISAIARNSSTNILATPQILALDNEEAFFSVGESVPVPRRKDAVNGSSSTDYVDKPVGISLSIKPQINKVTRFIRLEIKQKIDDFSQRTVKGEGVATINREANTIAVVRDRDTIAMGGLMRDKNTVAVSKVPLLGDIPILGWLFKNKTSQVEKVNLLLFLTPRILANYQKDAAENMRDLINRRGHHIKDNMSKDDPAVGTAKALYDKSKKQEKGPLYDVEEAQKYHRENEGPGIESFEEDDDEWDNTGEQKQPDVPDYQKITKEAQALKAEETSTPEEN